MILKTKNAGGLILPDAIPCHEATAIKMVQHRCKNRNTSMKYRRGRIYVADGFWTKVKLL